VRLPVPMEFGDKTFTEAEIRRPTGGVIADTKRVADKGDVYAAMATFVAGCLVSLGDETDRGQLRVYARELSYVNAEYLAIQALVATSVPNRYFQAPAANSFSVRWKPTLGTDTAVPLPTKSLAPMVTPYTSVTVISTGSSVNS